MDVWPRICLKHFLKQWLLYVHEHECVCVVSFLTLSVPQPVTSPLYLSYISPFLWGIVLVWRPEESKCQNVPCHNAFFLLLLFFGVSRIGTVCKIRLLLQPWPHRCSTGTLTRWTKRRDQRRKKKQSTFCLLKRSLLTACIPPIVHAVVDCRMCDAFRGQGKRQRRWRQTQVDVMKTDVCCRQTGWGVGTDGSTKYWHYFGGGRLSVSGGRESEEWGKQRERGRRCVYPSIMEGRLFPPHNYASVNLGFPIKRDHTANMKCTLCVERLIKYWLQTYMNLPHQIGAPVGGLPLIRCVWYGNEWRSSGGCRTTHFLCC